MRAVGQEVMRSLTPGQVLVRIVRDELTAVMGSQATDLNLNVPAPAVILMAGLQGAGKTTTVAKLAKHLKEKRKKKVMVVSADVYRPAAIEQLQTLAGSRSARCSSRRTPRRSRRPSSAPPSTMRASPSSTC